VDNLTPGPRREQLEDAGRWYADLGCAVSWTAGLTGDDAKTCRTRGWERTEPLPGPEFAAGLFATRGVSANPVVVLRKSGLVGVECDSLDDVARFREMCDLETLTVESSPGRRHFYFREPANGLEHVAFRFEQGRLTGTRNQYFVAPPALHKDGHQYRFLPEHGYQVETLPRPVYELLADSYRAAGLGETVTRPDTPAAKIPEGGRNSRMFQFASLLRGFGAPEDEAFAVLAATNQALCVPPLDQREISEIFKSAGRYPTGTAKGSRVPMPGPPDHGIVLTVIDEIAIKSIRWFEKPIWQLAAFHLLAGAKGAGKGTYLAALATRVSRKGLNVLFISTEDSAEIDLKPRLVAAGADTSRCFVIRQHVKLPDDIPRLYEVAIEAGGCGMLVIDPVANHIGDSNSNSDAEVRHAIAPLNDLANELECVLIGVRHPGKDRSKGAVASILGSTAWVDTPRQVVFIARDNEDDTLRHIQVVAGNRSLNGAGQAFRIEAHDVPGLEEPITKAVFIGESAKNVEDLLAAEAKPETSSRSAEARDLILDILENEGEQGSDVLDARVAAKTGLAPRTIKNIRMSLREEVLIQPLPVKGEDGAVTGWIVRRTAVPRP
jgi:hypothetical protein